MHIPRKRGLALTSILLFYTVAALLALATYAFAWDALLAKSPEWAVYTLFVLTIFRTLALILLWLWSKAGAVLWTLLTAIAIPIYYYAGYKSSFLGLIGVALLLFFVQRNWQQMQWGLSTPPHESSTV